MPRLVRRRLSGVFHGSDQEIETMPVTRQPHEPAGMDPPYKAVQSGFVLLTARHAEQIAGPELCVR